MSYLIILEGFRKQKKVIIALYYRELKTRISDAKFGFFGLILQPLGTLILFLLIFGFIRQRGVGNVDQNFAAIFLLCGIIHFTVFTEIVMRSLNALQANEALLFYRQVKPIDTLISRSYIETVIFGIVFIIIITGIFIIFEIFSSF